MISIPNSRKRIQTCTLDINEYEYVTNFQINNYRTRRTLEYLLVSEYYQKSCTCTGSDGVGNTYRA
jgi:hypothetical protein